MVEVSWRIRLAA